MIRKYFQGCALFLGLAFLFTETSFADVASSCLTAPEPEQILKDCSESAVTHLLTDPNQIYPNLKEALEAQQAARKPIRQMNTKDKNFPLFPSYSKCEKTFFRVATINKSVDETISQQGWKSGWQRRKDELVKSGQDLKNDLFDGLPPERTIEDRIVEYVRVKNVQSEFPKHSTIVGVLDDPIRTLSVGYHTGYNNGMKGDHMRMDEIEIGSCAKSPDCQKLNAIDSTRVFKDRGLTPRYTTEGEYAIDMQIPPACVVATYRIKFGKIDDKCYSDVHGNCGFGKSK